MIDPGQLAALAAIHRRGSFEAAAAQLGVTPPAVSLRLKALEERIGCLLIRRGSPAQATATGLRLIRHFEELSLLEAGLARDLDLEGQGPVTLRLAVNADSLATWVIPALAEVEGVLFDLEIDDQSFSQDWLKRGDVAGAVTSHPGPLQGCETEALGALRYVATASPAFVSRWFGAGVTVQTLSRAPGITFSEKDRLQSDWVEQVTGQALAYRTHRLASSQGFIDGALAGLGWGMNPEVLVRDHLRAGRLCELIPGQALDVPLYWQYTRQAAGLLRPLTRAMRHAAAGCLLPLRSDTSGSPP
ncbi:LysR family transcriptional regulator ArgP [Falsigemmobacter intermedius]|uniref:LysR family transcriptional regulator ArgP n=1 Tax=Falsigemmobacter intermedius TaxID=1553448 RepID=A0A444MG09_9RHOB|nr:LysR family transcriptional regulator ArgP [Falsigemmobacter intermedius]RWY44638.1 LysR family transcriptional regulator ArgP [Falsigemmobacter intermedius]